MLEVTLEQSWNEGAAKANKKQWSEVTHKHSLTQGTPKADQKWPEVTRVDFGNQGAPAASEKTD